ncbi:MAG: glycoside-pentoside-hexuronide (GPH):cation symporter, partial [Clostridia bacterium]
ILFLVARIWDGINDPIWGRIVDTRKVRKTGRYRHWLLWLAFPLALSSVLMFFKIPGLSQAGYLVYAYITYFLFDIFYTAVNIPYGSLASVMTTDEKDRSTLSIFRSAGSGVGGIPSMILASLCYVTVTLADGTEKKQMNFEILIIGVAIIAVLGVGLLLFCYYNTKERTGVLAEKPKPKKGESLKIMATFLKNRAFMAICAASMLLIAGQMFTQTYYLYLLDYYFNTPELYMAIMVSTYAPMAILMFFMNKIIARVGKKEICAIGMLLAAAANFTILALQTSSPYVFLALCFVSGTGIAFFVLEVWAMVNDVIDHHMIITGLKEEATSYSFFSFTRKLGQTIAGVLSTQALVWIGYKVGENVIQTKETVEGMYDIAAIVPAVLFLAIALILIFIYPLGKRQLAILQIQKRKFYQEIDVIISEE